MTRPVFDPEMVRETLHLLVPEGGVFEIRGEGCNLRSERYQKPTIISGYFDDIETAVHALRDVTMPEGAEKSALYVIAADIDPAILSRRKNRFGLGGRATSEKNVRRRRWLMIDLDPERVSGVPSTNRELALALDKADVVKTALSEAGWPEPVFACSGNGAHLLYRLDIEATPRVKELIEAVLGALARDHDDEFVHVDTQVVSAAQGLKLYGSSARKGDHSEERPWRFARFVFTPPEVLEVVTRESLRLLAAPFIAEERERQRMRQRYHFDAAAEDYDLESRMLPHLGKVATHKHTGESEVYVLEECPFKGKHHKKKAYVGRMASGALFAGCYGGSCDWSWKDLRAEFDPKDAEGVPAAPAKYKPREKRKGADVADVPEDSSTEILDDLAEMRRYFARTKKGTIKGTQTNAMLVLRLHPDWKNVIALNQMNGEVVLRKAPPWGHLEKPAAPWEPGSLWVDDDDHRFVSHCQLVHNFEPSPKAVGNSVRVVASANAFHPVKEWLESLQWDGVKRLDRFAETHWGADPRNKPTLEADGLTMDIECHHMRWWVISLVARAYRPGCEADAMIVLEGKQGAGKTKGVRTLSHNPREWYRSSKLKVGTPDGYNALRGNWIIELNEIDGITRKTDAADLKAFLSEQYDKFRPAYGKREILSPRGCGFVGTVNPEKYLVDHTGNRRFRPIYCHGVDLEGIRRDHEQVFAEAVALFKAGIYWDPVRQDQFDVLESFVASRVVESGWMGAVVSYLQKRATPEGFRFRIDDVFDHAGSPHGKMVRHQGARLEIGNLLEELGLVKRKGRICGKNTTFYEAEPGFSVLEDVPGSKIKSNDEPPEDWTAGVPL